MRPWMGYWDGRGRPYMTQAQSHVAFPYRVLARIPRSAATEGLP
jgi:hypothetical protein